MSFDSMFSSAEVSASGLAAERMRMEIAANNIANARSTRAGGKGPFRRQQVVFESALADDIRGPRGKANALGGVRVVGVSTDSSPFPRVFDPGHPDADKDGMVTMPNVTMPFEMVDLVTASRAYEANLKALSAFRQMAEQSLSLLQQVR
ncbi:MAG: flagellar basal body rod protein FlgC [Planctomycetaceae bacterium]|nr:flagellar basal body rod protein FlgC [Planctomycetaceae bacterium]